jgi:hypothetical protein
MSNLNNQTEYENEIKEQRELFNSELEKLNTLQNEFHSMERKSFNLLKKLYKNKRNNTVDLHGEEEYEESIQLLDEHRIVVYTHQTECFNLLQKLRNLQNNYLVGIINGLQDQIKELSKNKLEKDNNLD